MIGINTVLAVLNEIKDRHMQYFAVPTCVEWHTLQLDFTCLEHESHSPVPLENRILRSLALFVLMCFENLESSCYLLGYSMLTCACVVLSVNLFTS